MYLPDWTEDYITQRYLDEPKEEYDDTDDWVDDQLLKKSEAKHEN